VIQSWPGGANLTSPKVPSKITYDPTTNAVKWGFQIKPFQPCIECFKLFLDPSHLPKPEFLSLNPGVQTLSGQFRGMGINGGGGSGLAAGLTLGSTRNVGDIVKDYLQCLFEHTITVLNRALGQAFVESTKIEWVLTCPAVWSDKSKAATLAAAERTGMKKWGKSIRLISEPEAAALYTLKTLQPSHLEVGNNFVVCDAGGGTVVRIFVFFSPLRIR
jgi:hypothetical protein